MNRCAALGALIIVLAVVPALADPGIDFTAPLINPLSAKPFVQPSADCKPGDIAGKDCAEAALTLGDAAITALETVVDQDKNIDAKTKFERDNLARKIYQNNTAVLSVDEIKIIKDRIGLIWSPAVVGASWRLLDPSLNEAHK